MNPFDIIPFVLIAAVIYFLIIKPQVDERKEHDALVASLARDDRVVTSSGIHGKIVDVGTHTVVIEIAERTRVTFEKSSVVRREGESPGSGASSPGSGASPGTRGGATSKGS